MYAAASPFSKKPNAKSGNNNVKANNHFIALPPIIW